MSFYPLEKYQIASGHTVEVEKVKIFWYVLHSTKLFLTGLPHEAVAKLIAERFAKRDKNTLTLVVMDQKLTPAEMRRSFMQPQN